MCVIVGHLHIQSYSSIIYSNINIGSYWMYRLRSESQNPKNNIGAKLAGDLWSCPASVNVMEEESTETRQGKVATWPSPMEKMSYQVNFTIDFIWCSMIFYDFIWFYMILWTWRKEQKSRSKIQCQTCFNDVFFSTALRTHETCTETGTVGALVWGLGANHLWVYRVLVMGPIWSVWILRNGNHCSQAWQSLQDPLLSNSPQLDLWTSVILLAYLGHSTRKLWYERCSWEGVKVYPHVSVSKPLVLTKHHLASS